MFHQYITDMSTQNIIPPAEFFREVTIRITGHLSPESALLSTLDYLKQFIPIDTMGFYCFNPEKTAIQILAEADASGKMMNVDNTIALPMDEEICQWLIQMEQSEQILTIFSRPEEAVLHLLYFSDFLSDPLNRSVLTPKLTIDRVVFGALLLTAKGNGRFTAKHGELIRSVERPLAIALSNGKRFLELEQLKNLLRDDNTGARGNCARKRSDQVETATHGSEIVRSDPESIGNTQP
jgi:transcriptional regulator with GAF, ATPase, and Fis domain